MEQLSQLPLLRFPRCIKTGKAVTAEIHIFADASQEAYAAAAYLVCWYQVGDPSAVLVAAKAHVAPRRPSTIPRMELRAAELAVRLRKSVLLHLKLAVSKITFWSDSLTVLYWLRDDAKRFQTFVHNKLQFIRGASDQKEWRWVPSAENPADLATRGLSPARLAESCLWKSGPPFIRTLNFPQCPQLLSTSEVIQEMKKTEQFGLFTLPQQVLIPLSRYSTFERPLRLCEKVLRWQDRARQRLGLPPLPPVRERAERILVRQGQQELLTVLRSTSPKTRLRELGMTALTPFVDEQGLVRGRGRLAHAATLPRDVREPFLLPRGGALTQLLLRHYHQRVQKHSGGTAAALNSFLSRYWTPRPRTQMYRVVRDCVECRRRLARPQRPPQAPLPHLRLPPREGPVAFGTTAFDCAGPYRVKRARSYEQHYMLLATCCHTRAVRLEPLSDLSADAFLMAFTRLSARGVNPSAVLTDNGTNFTAANRLLTELRNKLQEGEIDVRRPSVKWYFNPPHASHFGGVFERLIGAAKAALYHALPSHFSLTLEQLHTAFAEVEGLLNTRPLAYVGGEGAEITALTPNHFLAGAASVPTIAAPWPPFKGGLARRWEAVHKALEVFRRRFAVEVLPYLRETTKSKGAGRDLRVGDVVAFLLPSAARKWPLALVNRVFPGKDGRVRVIELWRPQDGSDNLPAKLNSAKTASGGGDGREPIKSPSAREGEEAAAGKEEKRQPIRNPSDTEGEDPAPPAAADRRGGESLPPRAHGTYFRRDVGAVALLLPVEETNLLHI